MNQTDSIRGLKVSEKAILDQLARTAGNDTGLAWLKQETLADRANCCIETVRQGTKRLEELKHISRFIQQAKVTLYLVHPGDSLHLRPQLGWPVFEEHLRRGRIPFSFYPNVAGWLAHKGLVTDEDATRVLQKYYKVKARRKHRSDSSETFAQAQKHWGHTLKKLGLDHQIIGADPPADREEYEWNNITNKTSIRDADETQHHNHFGPMEQSEKEDRASQPIGTPLERHPAKRAKIPMTEEERARHDHILAGVNRPDRYSFASDQPDTKFEPE